ncbi:MAG: hypothetical protein RR795_01175 [Cetobacterium sp.]|uniref:hypothetical protein n=1 Tax=Cetobacterium sp. TaxID=2071632 RepID=UPI002FC773FB
MDYNMIKELGIAGALVALFAKVYHNKDNQQNNQNDLLVQHLLESNKAKDEDIKALVTEFKEGMRIIAEELKNNRKEMAQIKEIVKNVQK